MLQGILLRSQPSQIRSVVGISFLAIPVGVKLNIRHPRPDRGNILLAKKNREMFVGNIRVKADRLNCLVVVRHQVLGKRQVNYGLGIVSIAGSFRGNIHGIYG
jgi:hypothetical protein